MRRAARQRGSGSRPTTVVAMRRGDLSDVEAIERDAYPRPWSRSLFEAELALPDRTYVVARRRGRGPLRRREVVGFGGIQVAVGEAHVLTVAVRSDLQGQGIGTLLVARLLEAARERKAGAATLEVRPSNGSARALYRRFGFEEVGRRPRYYEDDGEDALIMWLYDLQGDTPSRRHAARPDRDADRVRADAETDPVSQPGGA